MPTLRPYREIDYTNMTEDEYRAFVQWLEFKYSILNQLEPVQKGTFVQINQTGINNY